MQDVLSISINFRGTPCRTVCYMQQTSGITADLPWPSLRRSQAYPAQRSHWAAAEQASARRSSAAWGAFQSAASAHFRPAVPFAQALPASRRAPDDPAAWAWARAPGVRPYPASRPYPACHFFPVSRGAPAYLPSPAFRDAPASRSSPAFQPFRPSTASHGVPAFRPSPLPGRFAAPGAGNRRWDTRAARTYRPRQCARARFPPAR